MNEKFWNRALELALKARGFTAPNPLVGAVIVRRGKIIGEGFHRAAGKNHAEIEAIKSVGSARDLRGATMFVTLEPCCHYGKTPPCAGAIIDCGIKKVFVGMRDPFSKVNGGGIKILKASGVEVEVLRTNDEFAKKFRSMNQIFLKNVKTHLPYVTLKAGMTLDGKVATTSGDSKWITSEKARMDARFERSLHDAVLVGAETVRRDNPRLLPLPKFSKKNFYRLVLSGNLDIDLKSEIFKSGRVLIFSSGGILKNKVAQFEKIGAKVFISNSKKIKAMWVLKELFKFGIGSVFVEGGAMTHGVFWDEKAVDRALFYVAPKIMGGAKSFSAVGGEGAKSIKNLRTLKNVNVEMVGENLKVEGFINFY